jgi:hypothetical protein
MGSIPSQVKPKTMKLVSVVSLPRMQHSGVKPKTAGYQYLEEIAPIKCYVTE